MESKYNCVICGKCFFSCRKKAFTCGDKKCGSKNNYLRHKEKYIENARRWDKLNPKKAKEKRKKSCDKFRKEKPERFNELMRNNYRRNKVKWNSRNMTNKILNGSGTYKHYNPLKKQCHCGSTENLEVHHEEYPIKAIEIRKAIDDGKIYYKCRNCHGRRNGHSVITE